MAEPRKTRVAIIGCGMIADQHADQLRYLPGCELVAACDTDELMARQLADRFPYPAGLYRRGGDAPGGGIDAVHITTPAQSHFPLARFCLEAGCHVYVEKPFTVNAAEADELLRLAESAGRRITVGHNLQFSPEALRLRKLVHDGFLGGPPVHMECIQCYSHDDPTYGKAVLADPHHWVRRLPGSLLHNLVSHGVSKIAEFLDGDSPTLMSISFSSPYLVEHNHADIVDEVRAVLRDERGDDGFFPVHHPVWCGDPTNSVSLEDPAISCSTTLIGPCSASGRRSTRVICATFWRPWPRPESTHATQSSTFASSPGRSSRWILA